MCKSLGLMAKPCPPAADLSKLCKEWQDLLRMSWGVRIQRTFVQDFPNTDAWCGGVEEYTQQARIEVDPRSKDPERSLLHELLHLRLSSVVPWETAADLEEPVIWALTDALITLKRKKAAGRSKKIGD